MNKKTYGEELFERYLTAQGIAFNHEPDLRPVTTKLIDYVIQHPTHGPIYFEVKDIHEHAPASGVSAFDPYDPIRRHIDAGARKFVDLSESLCVIVLAAPPGSFVDLMNHTSMLGAMYGDLGFTIPFNPKLGHHDSTKITPRFLPGRGKMVRTGRFVRTRIAALVSLVNYSTFAKEALLYMRTDDGRTPEERWDDALSGRAGISYEPTPCVTVFENGTAKRRLPQDLFRGPMDAWWGIDEREQCLTFQGHRRLALGIAR